MRALLVLGLILFHTARIFDLLPFYVKNDETSLALMVLVGFVSQWGMPLFFVIAGVAAWHSLATRTPADFARDRFRRLIVPLIFGIFVLVPPQHYYNLRTNPDYKDSFWRFYPDFFRVVLKLDFPEFIRADPKVGLFGPAHLWFLYYLFAFSMLALPLFSYFKRESGRRFVVRLAELCEKPGGIFVLALPVIVIETLVLTQETTGWNRYAYMPFLLSGYLFGADPRFEESMCKHRRVVLVGGTLAVMAFFAISVFTYQNRIDPSRGFSLEAMLWRLLKSCSAFLWITSILGYAYSYKRRRSRTDRRGLKVPVRVRQMIQEAVMPFYIIHQTVIVMIGFYVVKWNTGITVKYLTIVLATFIVTLVLYELVSRANLARFLFGMKLRQRSASS